MNQTKYIIQAFAFPAPLIQYFIQCSNFVVATKLIKTCKALKKLHQKLSKCFLHKFSAWPSAYVICLTDIKVVALRQKPFKKLKILPKYVQILEELRLDYISRKSVTFLLSKFDLSQLKVLHFCSYFLVHQNILDALFQPSIKECVFHARCKLNLTDSEHPLLQAFSKLQNAYEIMITCFEKPFLTKEIFQKILKIQRKTKLKDLYIADVLDLDVQDIIEFCDTHLEPSGSIQIFCQRSVPYREKRNEIEKILEKRRQKGQAVPVIGIGPTQDSFIGYTGP